jgi:ubiquinone/menaquinone biosynthesis C-methylase UbiE
MGSILLTESNFQNKSQVYKSNVENDTQELAEKYDKMSNSQFENGLTLVDRLGVNEGSSVLDIGCGNGRLAAHVAKIIGPLAKLRALTHHHFALN